MWIPFNKVDWCKKCYKIFEYGMAGQYTIFEELYPRVFTDKPKK